ncbi:DUF2071 domain-containing protein [Lysinibacillus halotolerans]|uniref:DUF2071 domain-containing protein n=1 Tax=Lysinibacillus halotolerans TaxID=1368476 RepID=A0A3M8HG39_9BACI|nr:DUF2071 domain-containing protein [Lysinibacillus halotolerans]
MLLLMICKKGRSILIKSKYKSYKRDYPSLPWIMKQTWIDNLFIHYPVKKEVLQKLVPTSLKVDTYDGFGWVSVVPYLITDMRGRGLPPLPGIKEYPGFNIRTYVMVNDKPGVFFFYLAAANWFAAKCAKTFFGLPYFFEPLKMERHDESVFFEGKMSKGQFNCQYHPISTPYMTSAGSLDEWLLERYCLYTINKQGKPLQCNILHPSWIVFDGEAKIQENILRRNFNIVPESEKPILHVAKRADVRIWPLVKGE